MSDTNNQPTDKIGQARPFQFSLKQLLMAPVVLGLYLGIYFWWYPFSVPAIPGLFISLLFFRWLLRDTIITVLASGLAFLLISLVFEGITDPGEYARRANCANNIKQIGLGLHNYHDVHGHFPPAYIADKNGRPMHSWRVLILPHMEYDDLYKKYRMDEPWDGPNNRKLWKERVSEYECPEQPDRGKAVTSYLAVTGPGTMWQGDVGTRCGEIRDGTSHTIMVVESSDSGIHWMEPRDLDISTMPIAVNPANSPSISSLHREVGWQKPWLGANVLMADGGVRLLPTKYPPAKLKALLTMDGGEKVEGGESKD